MRYAICGGSPLGRRLAAFYAGAGIEIFEGYGLTETTAAATVTPPLRPRLGTVGWPLPGTAVRIADDGEVLLRGGQIFSGYWDRELGAAVPVTDNGWLATGDLGSLDEDGYLTIIGRKKDILITSAGKNVAPAPLEDWLRAHPLVGQCMVVGDNRPYVTALITLEADGIAHWRRMKRKEHLSAAQLVADEELLTTLQRAVDGCQPAGLPVGVDTPVPGADVGIHRGERALDAFAEAEAACDRAGLRDGDRGVVRAPVRLTRCCRADTGRKGRRRVPLDTVGAFAPLPCSGSAGCCRPG